MIRTKLHIDASPEEVFATLSDGEHYADWVVGSKAIRRVEGDFPRPGSRLRGLLGVSPIVTKNTTEVLRQEPPHLLELEARAQGFDAVVRFELHPDATGTTVVMEEEGANELSRLIVRAMRPLMEARNAETLWRLNAQVANGGDRRLPTPTDADHRLPVPRWLGDTTARAFGLATALRGARAFHPRGVTRRGTAHLAGKGRVLASDERTGVVVRFSRGAGLPARLPDVNGVAIRFLDAAGPGRHRDVLLASVGSGPLRHLLVPTIDFGGTLFSSVLRYRLDGEPVVLTAELAGRGLTLDRLRSPEPVELDLRAVSDGQTHHLATVRADDVIDGEDVRFHPGAADGELVPIGFLNGLRDPAYAASQAVRADEPGRDQVQEQRDRAG